MEKVSLIRRIVDSGRYGDLRALIEGESEYITDRSTGVPTDKLERRAWVMSVHHLRFLAEFGDLPEAEKDGRYLTPYPDDFEHWLQLGAPGIAKEDIEGYLAHNPL